ncbi:MAG: peptide-N-glycosidase [Bacteroidetes bacterium]|nr:peptide-N-glycosidase [Bacteroidota bacterium]
MRTTISLIIILIYSSVSAQNIVTKNTQKVVYNNYNNGKVDPNSGISLIYSDGIVYLSKPDSKIRYFMDYHNKQNVTIINYEDSLFSSITSFDSLPEPKIEGDTDSILGYRCKHASFMAFSNKIDVWYTSEARIVGAPYRNYIPNDSALVLKVVINGNRSLIADSIIELRNYEVLESQMDKAKPISEPQFEELKIKSRYTTMPIFNNETINFDPDYWKDNAYDSVTDVYHYSKGAVIMKKITLPEILKKGASVFAKLTSWSAGDAYDRTGSVFVIVPKDGKLSMLDAIKDSLGVLPLYFDNDGKKYQGIINTTNYEPPIELMRFFTSFGVGHFNDLRVINNYPWKEAAVYNQDVTSVIPVNVNEIWIGVFIGNYDKGGHRVNLELNIYPSFEDDEVKTKFVQPLFSTVNILEMSNQEYGRLFNNDTLKVNLTLPDSIENLQLIYTSTGHGGWGGGDEFNPKLNQIFIDGELIYSIIPWRTDCATYRLFNPASGNFGNGMSSSDLSRSNWCPATLTPPYFINLNELCPGEHNIEVVINQGKDDGGSFNHWGVTGVIVGDEISK